MKELLLADPVQGWKTFIPKVFGQVDVKISLDSSQKNVTVNVVERSGSSTVFSFTSSHPFEEVELVQNSTVLSYGQLVCVCRGGLIPGSIYETY